jgi:hypothetical protein
VDEPRGWVTDLGDTYLQVRLLTKGRRLRAVWHVGAPVPTTAADRVVKPGTPRATPGRIDRVTDVRADKKVTLSIDRWEDEMGNEVPAPENVAVTWTVDEAGAQFGNLTDNGDGTATLAAVGGLGPAIVHLDATGDGIHITGDEMYMFVAGDAQRARVATGPEEEVTPDV